MRKAAPTRLVATIVVLASLVIAAGTVVPAGAVVPASAVVPAGAEIQAGAVVPPGTVARQAPDELPPYVATFSILGFDPETGMVGGAVQSRVFSVGNGVLWGEADVGMVATQAIVDVSYGPQALELLRRGMAPADIVQTIWDNDPDPGLGRRPWPKAGRQFSVMNAHGEVATFSGPEASDWAGHLIGENCSAQGNILAGPAVVQDMVDAFESAEGHLSLRLMAALEAGQAPDVILEATHMASLEWVAMDDLCAHAVDQPR